MKLKLEPWTRKMGPKRWGRELTSEEPQTMGCNQEPYKTARAFAVGGELMLEPEFTFWDIDAMREQLVCERAGLGIREGK